MSCTICCHACYIVYTYTHACWQYNWSWAKSLVTLLNLLLMRTYRIVPERHAPHIMYLVTYAHVRVRVSFAPARALGRPGAWPTPNSIQRPYPAGLMCISGQAIYHTVPVGSRSAGRMTTGNLFTYLVECSYWQHIDRWLICQHKSWKRSIETFLTVHCPSVTLSDPYLYFTTSK